MNFEHHRLASNSGTDYDAHALSIEQHGRALAEMEQEEIFYLLGYIDRLFTAKYLSRQ